MLSHWATEVTESKLGLLWWFGPCHQVSPHAIAHMLFPPSRMVERTGTSNKNWEKQENLGQDEDILIQEAKLCSQAKQNKFLSLQQAGVYNRKIYPITLISLTFSFSWAFIAGHDPIWNSPFVSWEHLSCCVPSSFLTTHSLGCRFGQTQRGKRQWKRKLLVLCELYSALAKTLVCYQHCFIHKPKAQSCVARML